jgi:FKBP-type peptidyl-prolyl cis-trans isomerase
MARMRSIGSRVGTLLLAGLFLVTSLGFSFLVIWQIRQDGKQNKAQSAPASDQSSATKATPQEGKLEGTKLANFTPITTPVEKLQITDIKEGTGTEVKAGDTITAHYTGALAKDGTIFQSSHDTGQPFTSPLSNLIKGWQEGIPGMKAGGTRRLVIPAAEAYGAQSQPGIPANSDLVFDIELISIGQ